MSLFLIILLTLTEILLLVAVIVFYLRLRRSESLLNALQERQELFLSRLDANAELEHALVCSFEDRQRDLTKLESQLAKQAEELKRLIEQAEKITRSPASMRQMIIAGHRRGQSVKALAQATGLSVDEVELILMETRK